MLAEQFRLFQSDVPEIGHEHGLRRDSVVGIICGAELFIKYALGGGMLVHNHEVFPLFSEHVERMKHGQNSGMIFKAGFLLDCRSMSVYW